MRRTVEKSQSGFTLIELVVVIVILGILAATALPKFVDMSGDARKAAATGVAAALSSGSSINYSAALAKGQVNGKSFADVTALGTPIVDTTSGCNDTVATGLAQAGVTFATGAGNYAVSTAASATTMAKVGDSTTCTVTSNDDSNAKANFVLVGVK